MHDGFKAIRFDLSFEAEEFSGGDSAKILTRHDGHESLAYGIDWCYATSSSVETMVGCCSFCDHKMSIWSA
jgi:diphthamide biosynthesis protein 7